MRSKLHVRGQVKEVDLEEHSSERPAAELFLSCKSVEGVIFFRIRLQIQP